MHAPIAPGLYQDIAVKACRALDLEQTVRCAGPGTLAFDGERERTLKPGQQAQLTIARSGPRVLDVNAVLAQAAASGCFRR